MPHADRIKRAQYQKEYKQSHKTHIKQLGKEYYLANRDIILNRTRKYYHEHRMRLMKESYNLKVEILTHYGNGRCSCVKCGYNNILALSIDHINGDGKQHRQMKGVGSKFYRWLKNNNFPMGFQTLCMNCQRIKMIENNEAWYLRENKSKCTSLIDNNSNIQPKLC